MTASDTTEKSFFEKAAYIVTPGSVVFALLYYAGHTYRSAYYSYFGLRVSELEFTPQDYLLGSPAAIFLPLWVLLTLGIVGVIAFRPMERRLSAAARRGPVSRALAAVGVVLLLLSFPVLLEPAWWLRGMVVLLPIGWLRALLPAFLVAVGGLLLLFAVHLGRAPHLRGSRLWGVTEGLLVSATALIAFFAMARYAHGAGTSEAHEDVMRNFSGMTRVLVHSRQPIFPSAPTVRCEDRGAAYLPYRYRCIGFRVLAKTSTRYYLVPRQRLADGDITLLLQDDNTIRVEVRGKR
ncbi:hypothetical protein ABT147_46075 [Streptomyces sp. NPDC001868]|uniref:hypothetical protein n=1 Tax=Streptomyces sp. NPDC001868 TaxID=3154401 RepID=UPI00331F2000